MLICTHWMEIVVDLGTSPCNRACWVVFKVQESLVRVSGIYNPNGYRDRANLRGQQASSLPKAHWVVVGNFKIMELKEEKLGGLMAHQKGNEQFFQAKCNRCLNPVDPLEKKKKFSKDICFFWCNDQTNSQRIFFKLHWMYVDSSLFTFESTCNLVVITQTLFQITHLLQLGFSQGTNHRQGLQINICISLTPISYQIRTI